MVVGGVGATRLLLRRAQNFCDNESVELDATGLSLEGEATGLLSDGANFPVGNIELMASFFEFPAGSINSFIQASSGFSGVDGLGGLTFATTGAAVGVGVGLLPSCAFFSAAMVSTFSINLLICLSA